MDAHPDQTPLAVGPEIFSFFYSMLNFSFFSFYFLFCGRGPSQVTHPTPTTKTNPQPTNTMSTQLENLTRETSTPLHQLLSDKKIKKNGCIENAAPPFSLLSMRMTPWMQNCPAFNKRFWLTWQSTQSLWQNVHSRQQDFLFFPGWKIALWCWNVWSKRNSQLMCSALTTGWRNCI